MVRFGSSILRMNLMLGTSEPENIIKLIICLVVEVLNLSKNKIFFIIHITDLRPEYGVTPWHSKEHDIGKHLKSAANICAYISISMCPIFWCRNGNLVVSNIEILKTVLNHFYFLIIQDPGEGGRIWKHPQEPTARFGFHAGEFGSRI